MSKEEEETIFDKLKTGFLTGLGSAIGLTVGFALVSTLLINVIRLGGGLPLVGSFFASIVSATQASLETRK